MNNWNTIQSELTELNSHLASAKVAEAYTVPEGYFEGFAAQMLERIRLENASGAEELELLSPLLAGIPKKMPFSIPQGYFSQTSDVLPGITSEENLPEFLATVGKTMPFEVPAGYFESLPGQMLDKVGAKKEQAKVIQISSFTKWKQYAAAAVVAGAIALGSIFYFTNKSTDTTGQPQEWVAKNLKNVSDKELDEFINAADASSTALANSGKVSKTEVRKLLNDVPDSELDEFLNELPTDNEDMLTN
jgi:hypothetical protein